MDTSDTSQISENDLNSTSASTKLDDQGTAATKSEGEISELLISAVRRAPWLWNPSRQDYRDRDKKRNSWDSIGKLINATPFDAQKKFGNLRTVYNKYVKGEKHLVSGSEARTKKKWPYMEQMRFLKDTDDCPSTSTNFHIGNVCDEDVNEDSDASVNESNANLKIPPAKKMRSIDQLIHNQIQKIDALESDEDYQFGQTLACSLKKLQPSLKREAKLEFLQVINRYEVRQESLLCPPLGSTYNCNLPSPILSTSPSETGGIPGYQAFGGGIYNSNIQMPAFSFPSTQFSGTPPATLSLPPPATLSFPPASTSAEGLPSFTVLQNMVNR